MQDKIKTQPKKIRSIFHWHRQLGLVVSLFVIILSVTGVFLNHTEELQLDSEHVKSELLLKWYGIKNPDIHSYSVGENWLSHVGDKIYFNEMLVEKEVARISGAIAMKNFIAVATQNELILLTHEGEKIERLNATTGVPGNILEIGEDHNESLILKTNKAIFQANADVTEWSRSNDKNISQNRNINWASSSDLPTELATKLNTLFRGEGLSKERVLLDLHSGRIFGKAGPFLMDLSAILLIVLSLSGCWMYAKRTWIIYKRNQLLAAVSIGDTYSAADLKRGEEGVVLTVIGDETLRQRLASMGVMAGTIIAAPSSSIFGDPRTYIVRGYQLCMRTTEAAMILLQTEEQSIDKLKEFSNECPVPSEKKSDEN